MNIEIQQGAQDHPADLVRILAAIEDHPGIWLLSQNLDYLFHFIAGYQRCLLATGFHLKWESLLNDFTENLRLELGITTSNPFGWYGYLREVYGGEEKGYKMFFHHFNHFKESASN
jgi:hypothetical protein